MTTSRRTFLQSTALTGLGLSLFHQNLFAGLLNQDPVYKMTPLRNSIGYFTERGGTIGWMITIDGIVVIDTQFPDQSKHLIAEIQKKSERKIDLLINTHHHGDHTSGNIAFEGLTETILAHENSKKNQMRVAKERDRETGQLYPDTTFTKEWSKKVGSEVITLRYFGPGHTDGDAITHFENANIVHMGDLIFNRRFPYIDKSAGASVKNWITVLQETVKIFDNDTKYIFGHSGEGYDVFGSKNDLLAMQNYLAKMYETVKSAKKAGKSDEEIMNIESIQGAEEWKGNGIQRSLSAALEELASE
jgi:glyoxylase-like metal-dependent hydrolase (beta-lactamase superfamily II)